MTAPAPTPPARRSRSTQRRGPKPAEAAARAVPEGGYQPEESDRHLSRFYGHFAGNDANDVHFRATRMLVVAARRWRKLANERIKSLGQTMARWETLFLLGFSGEELTQGELARLISVEGPTMVHMLDALARDGMIERHQSETDRRKTTNRITPAGTSAVGEIMQVTDRLRHEMLHDIDPAKLATAMEVLDHIVRRLDQMRRGETTW